MDGDGLEPDGHGSELPSDSRHQDSDRPPSVNEAAVLTMVRAKVRRRARKLLPPHSYDEVEEIAQKVTNSMWLEIRARPELAGLMIELTKMMNTYASNAISNWLRDHRRVEHRVLRGDVVVGNLPSKSANPHDALEKKQLAAAINRALHTLNDTMREAFCLHHLQDYKAVDIAMMYGVPVRTASNWLYRSKLMLRIPLTREGYGPETEND